MVKWILYGQDITYIILDFQVWYPCHVWVACAYGVCAYVPWRMAQPHNTSINFLINFFYISFYLSALWWNYHTNVEWPFSLITIFLHEPFSKHVIEKVKVMQKNIDWTGIMLGKPNKQSEFGHFTVKRSLTIFFEKDVTRRSFPI